jgi:hypothetical protein
MRYSKNCTRPAGNFLQITMVTLLRTCATHRPDWKHQADRSRTASSEQSDARERRSQADQQWKVNRRRPVIGDVTRLEHDLMTRTAGAISRIAVVATFLATSQATAFSQTTKVAFGDHTVRLPVRWSWTVTADGKVAVLPCGYEHRNGIRALTIRRALNEKQSPLTDVIDTLKQEHAQDVLLDESIKGFFKYPTRWLVVNDPDAASPGVLAIFVSDAGTQFVVFEYRFAKDRWKHCMSTAIKIAQTLDR